MAKKNHHIRVVELFAGVGGFRIGLEGASDAYETVWNNQWEPSTVHQDASIVYRARFGERGHSNLDINLVKTTDIPDHDLLVGGFPCQDYSVAASLSKSGGITGKKGVLWWQIYRILQEKGEQRPAYLFFENVDRLINSPASQRGRDFAIILASLSDLGYIVEWRIVNAADYGMPQRRRRTYIVGYREDSMVAQKMQGLEDWMLYDGVMAESFPATLVQRTMSKFEIEGSISEVSEKFNLGRSTSPFGNAGVMAHRWVFSADVEPHYEGTWITLGSNLVDEDLVPDEYFITEEELPKWEYEKGPKKIKRTSKEGFEYLYSEGGMAFPDYLDRPSRTIITGEGGTAPSRFKHVVKCKSGRHRRLIPLELERLNMFPDNHTYHPEVSDARRAFLMGNALVCGVVEQIGKCLYRAIYDEEPVSHHPIFQQRETRPMLDFDLFTDKTENFVVNLSKKNYKLDMKKRLLIGLVKKDNQDYFLKQTPTKIYYTGKTRSFPSTIALNKLYYFMPYIKGHGVRDLYLINVARIGTKAEVQPESEDTEPRLVFDLEYLESLPDYVPVKLQYLRTYRDTVLGRIIKE